MKSKKFYVKVVVVVFFNLRAVSVVFAGLCIADQPYFVLKSSQS